MEAILQVYAGASEEALAELEACLLELEQHPDRAEVLNEAFRLCHTVKGDSKTVGFGDATELAHVIEEVFDQLRSGERSLDQGLVTSLLAAVDSLGSVIRTSLAGQDLAEGELQELITRHARDLGTSPEGERPPEDPGTDAELGNPTDDAAEDLPRDSDTLLDRRHGGLRIRIDVLDRMLDLTGELAIARNRMGMLISQDGELSRSALREAHRDLDLLLGNLQGEVMQARMVPIGPVFRQHMRTVRDLALAEDKHAVLEISGADVELDTTVIEHVRECLGHVIRNAVAHGIESPVERERAGKDPCGRIGLTACHDDGSIVVEVVDDGRGLESEAILARARSVGLVSSDRLLSESEITDLVFAPGFSMREEATLGSGRGVGMDVVRKNLEALGGTVRVSSHPGKGTTVSLRLPLTLAIIEGFEVAVGKETYVIPLASVVECLDLVDDDAEPQATGVMSLRGRPLPYVRLRKALGIGGKAPAREGILVVQDGAFQAGVAVDSLLGESQAVIKPLGKLFRDLPGVAGSTIQASGDVALILDVPALLQVALRQDDKGLRTLEPAATSNG